MANDVEDAVRSYLTSAEEDLITGVSFMVPFVIIDGIFLALGYTVASLPNSVQDVFSSTGTVGRFLAQIGATGLTLMVPVFGTYIAHTIADCPDLAPGFIPSYIIRQGDVLQAAGDVIGLQGGSADTGHLSAIVAGFLAGTVARWLKQHDVPEFITPMMPVLLIPVATAAVFTLVMLLVLGVLISTANTGFTEFLNNM